MEEQIINNQIALFNLLCALFYRVTGHMPKVRIWTKDGAILTDHSFEDIICQEEISQDSVVPQKAKNKGSQPYAAYRYNQTMLPQVVSQKANYPH